VTADVGLNYERIGEGVCAITSADIAGVAAHGRAGLGLREVRGGTPWWGYPEYPTMQPIDTAVRTRSTPCEYSEYPCAYSEYRSPRSGPCCARPVSVQP
jgi:hypothetical protein